jgi:holo-[acyl-carrier protein] synthase
MMQILCGIDIVRVDRIKKNVQDKGFAARVFTQTEIDYCEARKVNACESYAARYAAKEAFAKALGTGIGKGILLKDIEVYRLDGKPALRLYNKALELMSEKGRYTMDVSISHTDESAVASVVILIEDQEEGLK